MKLLTVILGVSLVAMTGYCRVEKEISKSFELRYYSPKINANGITDFKGPTEIFDTAERIQFLDAYTDYAATWFQNPNLDQKVVSPKEIESLTGSIKAQPSTQIRKTIPLKQWKSIGFKPEQTVTDPQRLAEWCLYPGASITNEQLRLFKSTLLRPLAVKMDWRFKFQWKVAMPVAGTSHCLLQAGGTDLVGIEFDPDGKLFCETKEGRKPIGTYTPGEWVAFAVEVDLENWEFNLIVNGTRMLYGAPLKETSAKAVDGLHLQSDQTLLVDDLFLLNLAKQDNVKIPFRSQLVLNENFTAKPSMEKWNLADYEDAAWNTVTLPAVHGGIQHPDEALFLRKTISVGSFEKGILNIETLDPGGEIWVNGQCVATITNRFPIRLDISKTLRPNTDNLIALKVNPFKLTNPMHHAAADPYVGWFAGRSSLELSSTVSIKQVLVNTQTLDGKKAIQQHRITIENSSNKPFNGQIGIQYSAWFPIEKSVAKSVLFPVSVPAGETIEKTVSISLPKPSCWTFKTPNLYKVEVLLKSKGKKIIDDAVVTTGIRTIAQDNGIFTINNVPEMLNGVQIMGARMPIETIATHNRCAPLPVLVEELLMTKKCNSNMLRIHVHSAMDTADGINDPRFAELCDQMGIMLIWQTPSWLREGAWEAMDLEGIPRYMKQVYNHPSIVIWEFGNHPNRFKKKPVQNSIDFVQNVMQAVLAVDTSRLITPTTFWAHTHFGNDAGTKDNKGNALDAPLEYTHPLCTRGTQDAVTGYGAQWSNLRQWPRGLTKDCLDNHQRAFFNFEHEESAAQPNWTLAKGKPWYNLHSYEWGYEKGSIGRKLETSEWRASQGWQAFSAYESMKKQRLHGIAGFSWCCLHGGPNSGTYKKPIIDALGYGKLAYYTHQTVYQRVLAGSDNVDVAYGPDDTLTPVIMNLDEAKRVTLRIQVKTLDQKIVKEFTFKNIQLEAGRSIKRLDPLEVKFPEEDLYVVEYTVSVGEPE